jgi:type IV pilus assembly protein PilY1
MANFCALNVNTTPVADPSSTDLTGAGSSAPGFILEQGLMNTRRIYTFTTRVAQATAPTGLVEKYSDRIRFGAMTFQNDGSATECGVTGSFACAKACYSATDGYTTRICYLSSDCPTGQTCQALPKADGGKVVAYVGAGNCSVSTTVPCFVDADCSTLSPASQYCKSSIGDHSPGKCSSTTGTTCTADANCPSGEYCRKGLLRAIDDIPATSWTPFAEGFYNAMGYFARSNDYTVTVPTSRSDSNFSQLPAANTATSYVTNRNPSQFRCQSNNIMLITDGMSTADKNTQSEALAALYASQVPYTIAGVDYKPADSSTTPATPATTGYDPAKNHGYDTTNQCPPYSGSRSVGDLAWIAKNRNIKALATSGTADTATPQSASESITTYVVYSGPQTTSQPGLCDPKTLMTNTAKNGGTQLFSAAKPSELNAKIDAALSDIAAKAASGTAASILSNSEGSGANILQAVFYPRKIFNNSTYVNWIGEMQNLWYYVDPYIHNSTIREDTDTDRKLLLNSDYIVRFAFDNSSDKTMVQRYDDANGDSVVTDSDKVGGLIDPDYVNSIWRAGQMLWSRADSGTTARTIYTGYNAVADSTPQVFTNASLNPSSPYASTLWDDLQIPGTTDAQRYGMATKLINYVRGTDQEDDTAAPCLNTDCHYRNRKVTMGFCSNAPTRKCTPDTYTTDCPTGGTCNESTHEWKLGDIISSTPRVQSTVRLNTYNLPPSGGYNDQSYQSFINSSDYKDNGMVYVGANDGMIHAFNLGILDVTARGMQKASLEVPSGTVLGSEQWAFIPKNSLPFLKYFSDKDYDHIYYVDGRTNIFDASIGDTNDGSCTRATYWECAKPRNGSVAIVDSGNNLTSANTWRTVLIAGMGLGGASVDPSVTACTEGATGDCVKTPRTGLGYSSYFALDVTDPIHPKFLWEFSNDNLGFATTAPAIVRIGDKDKNGRWFAIFGNGPLGPIDAGSHQFKGQSIQHLRFFVVDLRTGELLATLNNTDTLGLTNAFVGTLLGGSIDADRRDITMAGNYQDDAVYAGYVQKTSGTGWTDGGVVRIMTKEDIDPTHWTVSKVISGIGPVTTAIARTQDTKNRNLWLYFGTGRFYFRDTVGLDDNDSRRSLFGIQEPCYNTTDRPGNVLDPNCTATLSDTLLQNQTTTVHTMAAADKGWRIDMDVANTTTNEGAERVVTDTVALTNGTVFFTSFKPTMDICGYGGNSFLWGVKYDTGGQAAANALTGKALIQLSTGEFKEVDLSTAFTDKLNRRMASPMTGKPPSDAPPIVSSVANKPVKKILHIQEH